MFTGLVDDVGLIEHVADTPAGRELRVTCRYTDLTDGESIAVNGACLTVREHGVTGQVGAIELVTNCRVFGYVFNPVSFFFCYDQHEALVAVVVEVNNTFGESHAYVLTPDGEPVTAKKVFHVSPFMTLDGTYRFAFDVSPDHLDVRIDLYRRGVPVFVSRLSLDRRPLTDRGLAVALVRYPLVTLAVIGRIHWQALRLWWKGATYYPKPPLDPEAARTGSSE